MHAPSCKSLYSSDNLEAGWCAENVTTPVANAARPRKRSIPSKNTRSSGTISGLRDPPRVRIGWPSTRQGPPRRRPHCRWMPHETWGASSMTRKQRRHDAYRQSRRTRPSALVSFRPGKALPRPSKPKLGRRSRWPLRAALAGGRLCGGGARTRSGSQPGLGISSSGELTVG